MAPHTKCHGAACLPKGSYLLLRTGCVGLVGDDSGLLLLTVTASVVLAFRRVDVHGVNRTLRASGPRMTSRPVLRLALRQLRWYLRVSGVLTLLPYVVAWHSYIRRMLSIIRAPDMPRIALVLVLAVSIACTRFPSRRAQPTYEVHAIRYGMLERFPVAALVAGADTSRRADIALMVWLARAPGRTVLVDAGFYRDKFMRRWRPTSYERPSAAIARVGLQPDDVTDIVISHVHWDHLDGADLFPRARLWIQRAEYEYYVDSAGRARSATTIDSLDAAMLASLAGAGRVALIAGDSVEIIPGITVYTGGKHTYASQYASVSTAAGTVVIASDNAYLYENLEQRRPITQTLDSLSNLRAQDRMHRLASARPLVVPGHDPAVFTRFPAPGSDRKSVV